MSSLLLTENFFDATTCAAIMDELRAADGAPATTYGRRADGGPAVDASARRTTRLTPPAAARDLVVRRLREAMPAIGEHFGLDVADCEEPQFLRYRVGDFFVAHQDGNTGLLLTDQTNVRRISTVVFLSQESAYGGGALVIHGRFPERTPVAARAGTLVAFRAETTHEVMPVTHGERYSIVSWYR